MSLKVSSIKKGKFNFLCLFRHKWGKEGVAYRSGLDALRNRKCLRCGAVYAKGLRFYNWD